MSWNSLADRQKSLDRAIEQCGVEFGNSDTCLRRVMSVSGASASEATFVKHRIELRLRTATLFNKTDDYISNTEKMLDQFEKDDEEWRRKGCSLAFDF